MFQCPVRQWTKETEDADEYLKRFFWHEDNCTCPIMDLHNYQVVAQDDHIRAYWEAEGRLEVTWSTKHGMLLRYPEKGLDLSIRYPY